MREHVTPGPFFGGATKSTPRSTSVLYAANMSGTCSDTGANELFALDACKRIYDLCICDSAARGDELRVKTSNGFVAVHDL